MRLLITGGFDPVHPGHIAAFNYMSMLGQVYVGLNSDEWLTRKKGKPFMPYVDRENVISSIHMVNCVIPKFDDSDDTACAAIKYFYDKYHHQDTLAFFNGGDRTPLTSNKKELDLCLELGIYYIFKGKKTHSSSEYINASKAVL